MPKRVDPTKSEESERPRRVEVTDEWRRLVLAWLQTLKPPNNTRQWLSRTIGVDAATMHALLKPSEKGGTQYSEAVHDIVRISGLPYPTRLPVGERAERLLSKLATMPDRRLEFLEGLADDPELLDQLATLADRMKAKP